MSQPTNHGAGFFDRFAISGKSDEVDDLSSQEEGLEVSQEEVSQESEALADETASEKTGRFSPELRRALVELMRSGVVLARAKPQVFELLCSHQSAIEGHLADMYLRLLIDHSAGVALLLQHQDQDSFDVDEESSTLISRRTLSLYDTLLLLVLRKHYQERQAAGEQQVIIDLERIESQLTPFLPLTNSSRSESRKLSGAIKKLKEKKLLSPVRGEEERWEITPVIRYVVNAEFLEQLLTEYQKLVEKLDGEGEPS